MTFIKVWTLIPHYCSTGKYLDKVIIIWNDVETIIPQDLLDFKCEVPLVYVHSKENKLTNRFIPYPEIKTEPRGEMSAIIAQCCFPQRALHTNSLYWYN